MQNELRVLLTFGISMGALACGGKPDGAAGSATAGASAKAPAGSASAAAKDAKLKHVQAECTFELDPPEELKQGDADGMSTTFKGKTVWFTGFAGSAIYGLESLTKMLTVKDAPPPFHAATANGINLVIGAKPSAPPENAVMGHGEEEKLTGDRATGCSFLCGGTKEREAEVVAMCKSVRIKVDMSKVK